MKQITIDKNDAGQRLDRFLKKYLSKAPLSFIYKALRKDVKLNGKRAKEDTMLCEGDVLDLFIPDEELEIYCEKKKTHRAKRQFTIAYEDENLIIVNKPFGLLVHGDKGEKKDTLANQVTDYLIESGAYVPRLEKTFVPSPVHRLDRNTTGLVVFGKNAESLRILSKMFSEDRCERKFYYALVCGELNETLHLKNKLLKDEQKNKVKVLPLSAKDGKYIETIVHPIIAKDGFSVVLAELVTGRSHQIRAHLLSAGYPLAGDSKYANETSRKKNAFFEKRFGLSTQLLHAGKIEWLDAPAPLDYLNGTSVEAPLPQGWNDILSTLFGRNTL